MRARGRFLTFADEFWMLWSNASANPGALESFRRGAAIGGVERIHMAKKRDESAAAQRKSAIPFRTDGPDALRGVLRWGRCRLEAMLFFLLLSALVPLWAVRATIYGRNRAREARLFGRWRDRLAYGLRSLRIAYWTGIRFERAADIWYHVALTELFEVLNATEPPAAAGNGAAGTLIVKLAHFGDALHIFPMLRALRRQRPGQKIDLLVGPWCAGLAKAFQLHDELLVETPHLGQFDRGNAAQRRSLVREVRWLMGLRRRRYEQVFSTSTTSLAEVLLLAALNPRCWVGAAMPSQVCEPPGRAVLVPYDSRRYEADRVMGLLELADGTAEAAELFFPLADADRSAARALLAEAGVDAGAPLAVLAPGAGWLGKQWPAERFAEIGDRLRREAGFAVVLVGSAGEIELCRSVAARMREPAASLAGRTSLAQLAALLESAALFVGNDSGPMHLAACFQIPSVVCFGPTVASKWAPRHARARVLQHEDCSGCVSWHFRASCLHGNRCMKSISADEVWTAISAVLGK